MTLILPHMSIFLVFSFGWGFDHFQLGHSRTVAHRLARLRVPFPKGLYAGGFFFCILLAYSKEIRGQTGPTIVSGVVQDAATRKVISFANIVLKKATDSSFVTGGVTDEAGMFRLSVKDAGRYILELSSVGYRRITRPAYVGTLSRFLDFGTFQFEPEAVSLQDVTVTARAEGVTSRMDKKIYTLDNNLAQRGGSILQALQNLPGVTVQDGKVQIRGSDRVVALIDGKQTALTGFGSQSGLDNIPASAVERIEIIQNPSARYDANGTAGIINIIFRKDGQEGFHGRVGVSSGSGALWEKRGSLPSIRPQYRFTPKFNPSLALNYGKGKYNLFLQGDYLLTHTLNKNEFVDRYYESGETVRQQTVRNRNTTLTTVKAGWDWHPGENDQFGISALFSLEDIIDNGDEPFFNDDLSVRKRLWRFLEDEVKTTVTASSYYRHRFRQPGRSLSAGFDYTFHREDEKYFFTNVMPTFTGSDAFKLLSDEHVADLTLDYVQPLAYGRLETGLKFRYRDIPTDMRFFPGINSPIDSAAGGWAVYRESIPAWYMNYVLENPRYEVEAGIRTEYVGVDYAVNPNHPTYRSDGYDYTQPFPNIRMAYKLEGGDRLTLFYNRRVDRPNEVDIRIFPKYDDAEIIKVGNPAVGPQFTHNIEGGYRTSWEKGTFSGSLYHRSSRGTITRIASTVPLGTLIYAVMQNAGHSRATGVELILSQKSGKRFSFNWNLNAYQSIMDAFTVENRYPVLRRFSAPRESVFSWNTKCNAMVRWGRYADLQLTAVYLAPDLIPQGRIGARFSLDAGLKTRVQKGKAEVFGNATDILNTMRLEKRIQGAGFRYVSIDYYETQVVKVGYVLKF
jgi:outer membrane receptor protein involved in Fe transport